MGTSSRITAAPDGRAVRAPGARGWSPARLGTYYRLASAILGDPEAAEDTTLAAFERSWRRRRKMPNVEAFEADLMREVIAACRTGGSSTARALFGEHRVAEDEALAWNIALEGMPDPAHTVEPAADAPAADAPAADAPAAPARANPHGPPAAGPRDSFEATLRSLARDDRAILVLRYATDMTADAIAAVFGTSGPAIDARLGQIEAALRGAIEHDEARAAPTTRPRRHSIDEEIRRRLPLPAAAPASLLERAEMRMTLVSLGRRPRAGVRLRYAVPIVVLVAAFAFVGTGAWRAVASIASPPVAPAALPGLVDATGRIDSHAAWAVRGNDLYITRDGGSSWSRTSLPARPQIYRDMRQLWPATFYPFFLDPNHGWLMTWEWGSGGGFEIAVHRTSDGGKKWTRSDLPGTYPGFGSVQFVDEKHGWATVVRPEILDQLDPAVGAFTTTPYGMRGPDSQAPVRAPYPGGSVPADTTTIVATTDGGQTWKAVTQFAAVAAVRFVSPKEGWAELTTAYGGGVTSIAHTTDGGTTWSQSDLPVLSANACASVAAPPAPVRDGKHLRLLLPCMADLSIERRFLQPGGAAPTAGEVRSVPAAMLMTLGSDDGGATWNAERIDASDPVRQSSLGLALSHVGPAQPLVAVQSYDSWPPLAMFGGPPLLASGIRFSFDGATWDTVRPPQGAAILGVEFAGPRDVWITVGSSSDAAGWGTRGYVYSSTDGGATWKPLLGAPEQSPVATALPAVTSPLESSLPYEPFPLPATVANVGFGEGVGWIQAADSVYVRPSGESTWRGVSLPQPGSAQAVSANVVTLLTTDQADLSADPQLRLFVTADAGATWNFTAFADGPPGSPWPAFAHFADDRNGYVYVVPFDAQGNVDEKLCARHVTRDGGSSWFDEPAPCLVLPTFSDTLTGWAVSATDPGEAIAITVDGGATWTIAQPSRPKGYEAYRPQALARESDGTLVLALSWTGPAIEMLEILHSTDNGHTWAHDGSSIGTYTSVAYVGSGVFVGFQTTYGATGISMWVTNDRGRNWTETIAHGLYGNVVWVHFDSPNHGWAAISPANGATSMPGVLFASQVFETFDAGATWQPIWGQ